MFFASLVLSQMKLVCRRDVWGENAISFDVWINMTKNLIDYMAELQHILPATRKWRVRNRVLYLWYYKPVAQTSRGFYLHCCWAFDTAFQHREVSQLAANWPVHYSPFTYTITWCSKACRTINSQPHKGLFLRKQEWMATVTITKGLEKGMLRSDSSVGLSSTLGHSWESSLVFVSLLRPLQIEGLTGSNGHACLWVPFPR